MLPYNQYIAKGIKIKDKDIQDKVTCISANKNKKKIETEKDNNFNIILKNPINKKYLTENLYIQNAFNFGLINKSGMMSYKNILLNEDNIGFNELPIPFIEKDSRSSSSQSLDHINFTYEESNQNDENLESCRTFRTKAGHIYARTTSYIITDNSNMSKFQREFTFKESKKKTSISQSNKDNRCFDFEESESSDESY